MTTNLWSAFQKLLPQSPLQIGTVQSIDDAAGTSMVELLGGGILTVRGTDVTVGSKAFTRAGIVEGQAPNLPFIEQEI